MITSNNPWKGLDSYSCSDGSIFFGRNKETDDLIDVIINNRFTVLYGPSGVGKSSLLNAGIRPRLTEKSFFVVDVNMRQLDLKSKKSISSQILSRVRECAIRDNIDISSLSKGVFPNEFSDSLWYFFHTNEFWSAQNELLTPIVIIDQFEDIFKEEVREFSPETFFKDLDELSNDVPPFSIREKVEDFESFRYKQSSEFRLVCSLREDYLPRLDDYVYSINIPELRKSRYGITLMDSNQAREVILYPSKGIVSNIVSDKIIDILSTQDPFHRQFQRIEPFLLSLFMYRVYNEMKKRGFSTISEELINMIGSDVVNDFYIESMKKVSPRAMRHLENVLLTPKGHRDSISYDKLKDSEKVTDEELKTLLDARIINRNTVNNVDRFEFTHDILSKYAQKNKEKREHNNRYQLFIGFYGILLTLLFSALVGFIKSNILSYIFIPISIILAIINSFGILNLKLTPKRRTYKFLGICGLLGLCLDLTQIIPLLGYVIYLGCCVYSFMILKKFSNETFPKITKPQIAFVWMCSFIIVPILCYGYNIYSGMHYSRGKQLTSELFFVKNYKGQYGLRNRRTIIIRPKYEEPLHAVNSGYIAKVNGKYGLLNSSFQVKMPLVYDKYVVIDNSANFYINDKEIAGNGLKISWDKSVTEEQKRILRKIVRNMVAVEGGIFRMGTNKKLMNNKFQGFKPLYGEDDIHNVSLSNYYINKYEVTLEEWIGIMGYDPRTRFKANHISDTINELRIPVFKVSYETCQRFIEKISNLTGIAFSLPTEAQWEYAARGGKKNQDFVFSGSNNEFDVGWISKNSASMLHPVGELSENSLKLYDMTGNVAEFCKDCFSTSFYAHSKGATNPCCTSGETYKSVNYVVIRGGSYDSYKPAQYTVTARNKAKANLEFLHVGFRLAVNP